MYELWSPTVDLFLHLVTRCVCNVTWLQNTSSFSLPVCQHTESPKAEESKKLCIAGMPYATSIWSPRSAVTKKATSATFEAKDIKTCKTYKNFSLVVITSLLLICVPQKMPWSDLHMPHQVAVLLMTGSPRRLSSSFQHCCFSAGSNK